MGNWWSGAAQRPRVCYNVVLPTSCRAWEMLYSGDINTWDAVAGTGTSFCPSLGENVGHLGSRGKRLQQLQERCSALHSFVCL